MKNSAFRKFATPRCVCQYDDFTKKPRDARFFYKIRLLAKLKFSFRGARQNASRNVVLLRKTTGRSAIRAALLTPLRKYLNYARSLFLPRFFYSGLRFGTENLLCIVNGALNVVFGKNVRKQPVAHHNAYTQIFRTFWQTAIKSGRGSGATPPNINP